MSQYIDAKELEDYLDRMSNKFIPCRGVWEVGASDAYSAMADAVASFPKVEAKPVIHAYWRTKGTTYRSPYARNHFCTSCGYETNECLNYCPMCGAKMDG